MKESNFPTESHVKWSNALAKNQDKYVGEILKEYAPTIENEDCDVTILASELGSILVGAYRAGAEYGANNPFPEDY